MTLISLNKTRRLILFFIKIPLGNGNEPGPIIYGPYTYIHTQVFYDD